MFPSKILTIAAICVFSIFILFGCVDKSNIKLQIQNAEESVASLSIMGFNVEEDQGLVNQAQTWMTKYESKEPLTAIEEEEILSLKTTLEKKDILWKEYITRGYAPIAKDYFNAHPQRKQFWKFIAMGSLVAGLNMDEVRIIKGKPQKENAFNSDQIIYREWSYPQSSGEIVLTFDNSGFLLKWSK